MKTKVARGAIKSWRKIRVKPYFRKVYEGQQSTDKLHSGFGGTSGGAYFNLGVEVPRGSIQHAKKHIAQNAFAYALGGGAVATGAVALNQKKKPKKRKTRKRKK